MPIPFGDHLLPDNATPLEKAASAIGNRLLTLPTVVRHTRNPDSCPLNLLPYLAAAWNVQQWDATWTEAVKRQAIKDSIWIHQHAGTAGALIRAISQLNLGATVAEWFQYAGAPYTFRLYVNLDEVTAWTSAQARQLLVVAINNKNVRSFLDTIALSRPPVPSPIYVGGLSVSRNKFIYLIAPVTAITPPPANIYIGAATISRQRTWLMPQV